MESSEVLIEKIKEFEGLWLKAYLDPAGVPTIGYGHTGDDVKLGDRISKYWAEDLLRRDLREVEAAVNELNVATKQGQFDALVSFAFNMGVERLKKSTLLKRIRSGGSVKAITSEWMRWVYADGKKLRGLVKRRRWEVRRFFEW
jgi:lysozyme